MKYLKKKIIYIPLIIISLIGVIASLYFFYYKNNTTDKIGISNKTTSNPQVKVLIDRINIRKNPSTKSTKIGIVKKKSVFDIIDYVDSEKYVWFHIKTNNNIEGYIASDRNESYVEVLNANINLKNLEIACSQDIIKVNDTSQLSNDIINEICKFNGNPNTILNYELKDLGSNNYNIIIKASDLITKTLSLEISKEITNNNSNNNVVNDPSRPINKEINVNCGIYRLLFETKNNISEKEIMNQCKIDSSIYNVEYFIDYNKSIDGKRNSGRIFPIKLVFKDKNNNSKTINNEIEFTKEKLINSGKWVNYEQFSSIQNEFKKSCSKYDYANARSLTICDKKNQQEWYWSLRGSWEVHIEIFINNDFCYYENYQPIACYSNGNKVDHSILENQFKPMEKEAFNQIRPIVDDFENKGYDFSDIVW